MEHDEFMRDCGERFDAGQRLLAASMRRSMAERAPELYEQVCDADDALFLEPLLFAHVSKRAPVESLPQLLVGALPPDARPDALDVFTDELGRLDVPGIGYFHTVHASAALVLGLEADGRCSLQHQDGSAVSFDFEPRLRVAGTSIDVQRYPHPLLAPLIQDTSDQVVDVDPAPAIRDVAASLARSFALLRELDPLYAAQIERSTRRVMLFHERPRVYSFASIAAHGYAFFSTQPHDDEAFFLEDICHQCAHVIWNAVTVRRTDYLQVDPELAMSELTGNALDPRKLYSAFHALYTYYNIMRVLDRCQRSGALRDARTAHELRGRMAFTARAYRSDIRTLDRDLYAALGRACYDQFKRDCERVQGERAALPAFDWSDQEYLFDYRTFANYNPCLELR